MLIGIVQVGNQLTHFAKREALRVGCHDLASIHVVNVSPHSLKRDTSLAVVVDNIGHLVDVLVAVLALVETEAPVGHHGGETSNFTVLPCNIQWARSSHEVEVEDTTNGIVLKVLTVGCRVIDLDIHSTGAQQEDSVCLPVGPVVKVNWVGSIEVGPHRNLVSIAIPNGPNVVCRVEAKGIGALSEPIKVRVRR